MIELNFGELVGIKENQYLTASKIRHIRIKGSFGKMLMAGEPLGDEEKPILIQSGFRRSVTMNGWRALTRPNETKQSNQKQELVNT